MTRLISRRLYRQLLLLYPQPFRQEFGDEMLSMFEECAAAQGSCYLLADVVFSAFRQQVRYVSTPSPISAPLYKEIGSAPHLARILAVAGLGAALLMGALSPTGKSNYAESRELLIPQNRTWVPTKAYRQYCSDAVEHFRKRNARVGRTIR